MECTIPDPGDKLSSVAGFTEGAGDPLQGAIAAVGVVDVGPTTAIGTLGHVVDAPLLVHPHVDDELPADLVMEYYVV